MNLREEINLQIKDRFIKIKQNKPSNLTSNKNSIIQWNINDLLESFHRYSTSKTQYPIHIAFVFKKST